MTMHSAYKDNERLCNNKEKYFLKRKINLTNCNKILYVRKYAKLCAFRIKNYLLKGKGGIFYGK